jgi:predicted ATPase
MPGIRCGESLKRSRTGTKIEGITLAPLARAHLRQLIADALRCGLSRAATLARLVHEKTAGNPFFVIQFLYALAEKGLLLFDHEKAQWSWVLGRIHAEGHTDNVVDLMVGKLIRLSAETQQALRHSLFSPAGGPAKAGAPEANSTCVALRLCLKLVNQRP